MKDLTMAAIAMMPTLFFAMCSWRLAINDKWPWIVFLIFSLLTLPRIHIEG
jgi:hypothetical protein